MATPAKKTTPWQSDAQKVKRNIDTLITKMQKDAKYTPTRDILEDEARSLIALINAHHSQVQPFEAHLKAAIIDLTEVPEMSPQMQRIAFQTALKDASAKIQLFLNCV